MLERAEHDIGNLVTGVSPNVDDLVVTLTIGDDALAILLLDLLDLFVGIAELQFLLLRNDHVGDADRDTCLGRFGKTKFLQSIQCFDGALLARYLVATPDDIAELLLTCGLIEKAESFWPNLVEDDSARGRLDDPRVLVAVDRVVTEVRISETDPIVRFHRTVGHR